MKAIKIEHQSGNTWAVIVDGVQVQSCLFSREDAEELALAIFERQFAPESDSQFGVLTRASYTIEERVLRSEVQTVLDDAATNADRTTFEVRDRSWESVFRGTLESLLCVCSDAVVADWFRAQGVAW